VSMGIQILEQTNCTLKRLKLGQATADDWMPSRGLEEDDTRTVWLSFLEMVLGWVYDQSLLSIIDTRRQRCISEMVLLAS